MTESSGTPFDAAPQHGPRPLPLFLDMLRSEIAANPALQERVLTGLRRYQSAARPAVTRPMPARHRKGRVRLRDYGGSGRPVVFVPSLINPPTILDLAPDRSLLLWIARQGFHPYLVDWGSPSPAHRALGMAAHVESLLIPLVAKFAEPPVLVGYCLGGTMALATASATPVAGLVTIAAPWRFAGYDARARMAKLWAAAKPGCEAMGLVPMEVLQTGFWQLDPARTIAKYAAFAAMPDDSAEAAAFVRLEDWANAGAPLPYAAGRDLFEDLLERDLPGQGEWVIGGKRVDPAALKCPAIEFVSLTDRIVPAATAAGLAERRDIGAGHVGMVIGGRAQAQLWEPLAQWIAAL